ncbi:sodium:calcium antiporter [Wenzhouxiangella sp. EGI_FJ10305]|uniref:sodium:calcium antiporter n=1 Tax=Wenzhouxiangella sp. EGI_FJ10305 TaxID=3243768 RepID=UPI0035DC0BA2
MPDFESWTLFQSLIVFTACTAVIGVCGVWITGVVDQLADRTGLGEAISGAVLLGAATSLSGSVLSVTAAWNGLPEMALGNAVGGIAVQTAFLVVADVVYRKANLEHAAASAQNMMQNALLIALLAMILLGPTLPDFTVWGIHPLTPLLIGVYIYGIAITGGMRAKPMWKPTLTPETRRDEPEDLNKVPALKGLVLRFLVLMLALGIAGWTMEKSASNIAQQTWLSATAVGVLFTAIATSLPELVTSVAAVRRGALTLAVGGIIGGNAFDTLFTAASDVAYRKGSIYHTMSDSVVFWTTLTLLMSAVLLLGLIRREKRGPGVIGVESVVLIVLYVFGVTLLLLRG